MSIEIPKKPEQQELIVDIELPKMPSPQDPNSRLERSYVAKYGNMTVNLSVECFIFLSQKGTIDASVTIYENNKFNPSAQIFVTFHKDSTQDEYVSSTNVKNDMRIIPGIGRALWLLSLKVIQKFAAQSEAKVRHSILKSPSNGLDSKKWDELFLPLLKSNGYTQISIGNREMWEKTYLP